MAAYEPATWRTCMCARVRIHKRVCANVIREIQHPCKYNAISLNNMPYIPVGFP